MQKLPFNSVAPRKAKIVYNFGLSECNRVNFLKGIELHVYQACSI